MAPPQRTKQRRRNKPKRTRPVDIWAPGEPLPEVEPIATSTEVGALLRSLGDPPMHNGAAAGHYFTSVLERAASVAVALALSADLLADDDIG